MRLDPRHHILHMTQCRRDSGLREGTEISWGSRAGATEIRLSAVVGAQAVETFDYSFCGARGVVMAVESVVRVVTDPAFAPGVGREKPVTESGVVVLNPECCAGEFGV